MAAQTIQQAFELAVQHQRAGRLGEAEAMYRQIIVQKPDYAAAYSNLGNVLRAMGRLEEAIAAHQRAIALKPDYAAAFNNLGNALSQQGRLDEASAAYWRAISLRADFADAYSNLGNVLAQQGRAQEAGAAYRQAIALKPNNPEAYYNLGATLRETRQLDDAVAAYRQAVVLKPSFAEAHHNLATTLSDKGQLEEAIAAYRQAIALKADYAEAHCNLGRALRRAGRLEESIAAARRAVALKPQDAESHHNLAVALLVTGDLGQGWEEYEWRWQCKEFPTPRRDFAEAQWDGSPLQGRSILLHGEQGFGDAIQFVRYLPMVIERGGRPVIECHPGLQRLFQRMAGDCPVLTRGSPLPNVQVHCPLMSLAKVFGTTLQSIPKDVPYLQADGNDSEKWRDRLSAHGSSIKVGLAWAGHSSHLHDRERSMPLRDFAPLAQVPGVRFYSLQKGASAIQAAAAPAEMKLIDWTAELDDFSDTAALVANLDLVISVDTAVVHLAGAMAKPVWTLLPFAPDWRWLLERPDSPWYPTMRLFRQPSIGDWETIMRQAAVELARFDAHASK